MEPRQGAEQRSTFAGRLQAQAGLVSLEAHLVHAKVEIVHICQVSCPPVYLQS